MGLGYARIDKLSVDSLIPFLETATMRSARKRDAPRYTVNRKSKRVMTRALESGKQGQDGRHFRWNLLKAASAHKRTSPPLLLAIRHLPPAFRALRTALIGTTSVLISLTSKLCRHETRWTGSHCRMTRMKRTWEGPTHTDRGPSVKLGLDYRYLLY